MTTVSMGATATLPPSAGITADQPPSFRDGPGRLRIDPRVVQKLAARAADEVEGVSRASVGVIGRALHHPVPASTPRDQVAIDLDLSVSIRYPLSLRVVVEQLASHVARRVEQLTDRPVGHVHVRVQRLGGHDVPGRPRVR